MSSVLHAPDSQPGPPVVPFNFDDLEARADECIASAEAEAAEIVAKAQGEADAIRREAAEEGCKAAMKEFDKTVAAHLAPAIAAIGQMDAELRHAKQAWISQWEKDVVRLASAIAARVIRRELRVQPDITLSLLQEALDLAAGSPNVRSHLNPEDYESLGGEVRTLIDAMSSLGDTEVIPDASVTRGGCRVETRFGTIDQQIESQLQRIEEELAA
jgi:flagellar assembly protein FliH